MMPFSRRSTVQPRTSAAGDPETASSAWWPGRQQQFGAPHEDLRSRGCDPHRSVLIDLDGQRLAARARDKLDRDAVEPIRIAAREGHVRVRLCGYRGDGIKAERRLFPRI